MLEHLSVGRATVRELAAPFDGTLPSFVQHLSVLDRFDQYVTRLTAIASRVQARRA